MFHSPAGSDPLVGLLLREVELLQLAAGQGLAEQEGVRAAADLRLVPDLRVARVPDVEARVVSLLAGRQRRELPLDVVDEVAQLLVPAEPVVAAVPFAEQDAGRGVERPLRLRAQLVGRVERGPGPALQLGAALGEQVGPAGRIPVQLRGLARGDGGDRGGDQRQAEGDEAAASGRVRSWERSPGGEQSSGPREILGRLSSQFRALEGQQGACDRPPGR